MHRKAASFFDLNLVSKIFERWRKRGSKLLGRNWENWPWEHFEPFKSASWSQRQLHKPSICLFYYDLEAIWIPFSTSSRRSDIISKADFVNYCASFSSHSHRRSLTLQCWHIDLKLLLTSFSDSGSHVNKPMRSESNFDNRRPYATIENVSVPSCSIT